MGMSFWWREYLINILYPKPQKTVAANHDSALDMVASEGRALHFSYALFLCTFLELGKYARMDARTVVKMCRAFLASLKNYCISPKFSGICQNTTIFSPDIVVFIQFLIVFALKFPQITLYLPQTSLQSPIKCTFLTHTRGSENALFSSSVNALL